MSGQGRRKKAVYPTARPAIWPGRQYTNLSSLLQETMPFRIARTPLVLVREISTCEGLLQAELNRDRQMHRHGVAIQGCRLILPLTQGIHGRLMEQCWPGNDLHGGDAAIGVNQRVHADIAGNVLSFGQYRIRRRDRRKQFGLLDIATDGKRSHGCSRLGGIGGQPCAESSWVRIHFVAAESKTGIGFTVIYGASAPGHFRSREANLPEGRFPGLSSNRLGGSQGHYRAAG